ncbi:MAG: hypothetical protein DMD42_01485 [Gemmatimonadetes bacterium]|nr:MAG: hypothetical protein DMD42_01485 [Gemmatimonadota bacterium]
MIVLLLTLQSIPSVAPSATFRSPRVRESSGVAVSRAHRGVLWTHNDSGDDTYVYATDLAGTDRGVVRIRGARAVDWEDIALGPCPTGGGACLYIADTGDNERVRKSVVIYAVPEPDPPPRGGSTVRSAAATALRLRYRDGPDDVEAIYVSPRDSALYLVSKGRSGVVQLYRVSRNAWGGDTVISASPLQRVPIAPFAAVGRLVTGAAIRLDGRLVAIRTYTEIYTFVPGAGGILMPSGRPVCNITGLEPQGEAIDFLDDSTFVLTSEATARGRGLIHTVRCPGLHREE